MRRLFGFLAYAWFLLAVPLPAEAAVSYVNQLVSVNSGATALTTETATTLHDAPPGSLALIAVTYNATISGDTVTDTAGNTWVSAGSCTWNTTEIHKLYYSVITTDLPTSSTVTLSWTSSARVAMAGTFYSGAAASSPLDVAGACTSGTGTAPSITTAAAVPTGELVVGTTGYSTSAGAQAYNTPLTARVISAATTISAGIGDYTAPSTASVTFSATNANSVNYVANVWTFKAASGATNSNQGMLLRGIQ